MTLSHSAGGRPSTSLRSMVTSGCSTRALVTASEKRVAVDSERAAGRQLLSRRRLAARASHARRISSCRSPTALFSQSSDLNELEHTSSARPSVLWASVIRTGRISCTTTGTRGAAICQAASDPASPPPMM